MLSNHCQAGKWWPVTSLSGLFLPVATRWMLTNASEWGHLKQQGPGSGLSVVYLVPPGPTSYVQELSHGVLPQPRAGPAASKEMTLRKEELLRQREFWWTSSQELLPHFIFINGRNAVSLIPGTPPPYRFMASLAAPVLLQKNEVGRTTKSPEALLFLAQNHVLCGGAIPVGLGFWLIVYWSQGRGQGNMGWALTLVMNSRSSYSLYPLELCF